MAKKLNRYFIAGAVCPQCGVMDRIVVYTDSKDIECIACNYTDNLNTSSPNNPSDNKKEQNGVQVIKIYPPPDEN